MLFSDSFVNLVSGLGTDRDKASYGRFKFDFTLSKADIEAAYRSNWLVGKMIDAPADDMTREWRTWNAGERQTKSIKATEKKFNVRYVVNRALKMARLYGGAAILIGDGTSDPSKPLDVENFPKGGLKYLHALSRWEIWASTINRDPLSPYFGQPEYYMLNDPTEGGVQIHPSRVIRFQGIPWLEMTYTLDGWGFSILERFMDEARNVTAAAGNLASMTYEGKLDVIHIPGLTQNVTSQDYRAKLLSRFSLANLTKSTNNAIILDAEEEWEQKTINLSNLPEGIRTLLEIAAGAADMPVTRLLGTSPKGLNATGQSELRNYYDMLAGDQEVELTPSLDALDTVLVRHSLGTYPEGCHYEWNPLWQMTEAEEGVLTLQNAQSDQIYATMSVMAPDAMREAIQGKLKKNNTYPGLAEALEKYKDQEPEALQHKEDITKIEIDTPSSTARKARADASPLIDGKATKVSAKYTPDGTEREHCSICKHFLGDGACDRVKGHVVPGGWCRFFDKGHHTVQDAEPRTLFVSRPVLNATEILRWARKQGIPNLMKAVDLHVTVAYSKEPIDWFRAFTDIDRFEIPAGGPRLVEPLGDDGAVVLLFSSDSLQWRWEHFRNIGASWDWGDEYQPHVTLTWNAGNFDLSKVQPYTGRIILGPERFAQINDNWRGSK